MKMIFHTITVACLFLLVSCTIACGSRELTLLSYNVDNLFDGVDDGSEYGEYDPGTGAWNDALYKQKLARISAAVKSACPNGPDILLLQEIENANVMQDLVGQGLAGCGYVHVVVPPDPKTATTVGIASRLPVRRSAVYELADWEGNPVRQILEVTVAFKDQTLIIFNNHWKSKTEGVSVTESSRLEAAGLIARRVREIRRQNQATTIIAAGDLNECHDEYERTGKIYQTALITVAHDVPESFYRESLMLTALPQEAGVFDRVVFFEPWLAGAHSPSGSYVYAKKWETLDHILIMRGTNAWPVKDFHAITMPDLLDPRSGFPLTWTKKHPGQGSSDHLPVLLVLQEP